jgi:hypothetical protein
MRNSMTSSCMLLWDLVATCKLVLVNYVFVNYEVVSCEPSSTWCCSELCGCNLWTKYLSIQLSPSLWTKWCYLKLGYPNFCGLIHACILWVQQITENKSQELAWSDSTFHFIPYSSSFRETYNHIKHCHCLTHNYISCIHCTCSLEQSSN